MTGLPLQSVVIERDRRFRARVDEGRASFHEFESTLAENPSEAFRQDVAGAYRFGNSIQYRHPGLSPSAYFSHPVRVATLAMHLLNPGDAHATQLALLHNVFEVTDVGVEVIVSEFGEVLASEMNDLTVDRTRTGREYTGGYYRLLADSSSSVRIIKVLDKLDNLFLLCTNPDDQTRSRYLDDIEEFVVPFARRELPLVLSYLQDLVKDCRRTGHLSNPYIA